MSIRVASKHRAIVLIEQLSFQVTGRKVGEKWQAREHRKGAIFVPPYRIAAMPFGESLPPRGCKRLQQRSK